MKLEPITVVLVERDHALAESVRGALDADGDGGCGVVAVDGLSEAAQELVAGDIDAMLLGSSLGRAEAMEAVEAAHRRLPWLPVVVLVDALEDEADVLLLRTGAQDVVAIEGAGLADLPRTVRYAVERSPLQGWAEEADGDETATIKGDSGDLDRMCGPVPAPATGRSLGSLSLRKAFSSAHSGILEEYGALLDLAFEHQMVKSKGSFAERLNGLADELGLLSAGPRDVVDLHKAVIARKLARLPRRKAQAYAVEGRLLLLQLMGYLVSFYRGLTWGRRGVIPENPVARGPFKEPVLGSRDQEK